MEARRKQILLLTNSELGEANVFLATCHALLQRDPQVQLHFATFSGLEDTVDKTWQHARVSAPEAEQITFHAIRGISMTDGVMHYLSANNIPVKDGYFPESFSLPLGFVNTKRAIRDAVPIFVPYDGPQLATIFSSIVAIIKEVEADLVVVDSLMTAALTACYHLGVKFVSLSPNSIKDFAAASQPRAAGLWKFPALFSGFPYPVPWHLIPHNVFYVLYAAATFLNDKHRRHVAEYLMEHTGATLRTPLDLLKNQSDGLKIIAGTLPEIDFPCVLPANVFPCGPIVRKAQSVSEADPDLAAWLSKGPTIYVNLGSLCRLNEEQASEIASALKATLDASVRQKGVGGLQVLWKLSKSGQYKTQETGGKIYAILAAEIETGLVRIVSWLAPEPTAILQSGHIACSVHHGGANSYNEAIVAGVPQVVLPQWTDCYDYAQRVEMLGIGRLGSTKAKPRWTSGELASELSEVLFGESSNSIKHKAREMADICEQRGNGAANAAKILLAECVNK